MLEAFADRMAFITGGASGIGLGMAEAFVSRGLAVVLADIDEAAAEEAATTLRSHGAQAAGVALDVRSPENWTTALDVAEARFGPIAILCSNAGVAGSVLPIARTSLEGWRWTMGVNLEGCFHAMRLGVPRLLAHGLPAHFVATASLGAFAPFAGNGVYSASKAGVIALCESLRHELAETSVGVSVLSPGLVRTGLLERNDRLAPEGVDVGQHDAATLARMRDSTDPRLAGEVVVQGIETNAFWLFTASQSRDRIQARMAELAEAQSGALEP